MRPPLSNYGGQPQHAQRKTADNFYRNGNAAKVKNTQQSGQGGMAPVKKALSLANGTIGKFVHKPRRYI